MGTHAALSIGNRIARIILSEEIERHPCTLDWQTFKEMNECLDKIEESVEEISAVVLESSSSKSFVVGANISALEELNPESIINWVHLGHDVLNRLTKLPIATIAKVKYLALGGGLEIAMGCDFIISSDQAKFGQPEATLGVMPGWGGSYRLAQLVGPARAKQLFMTGEHITAKEAYEWGLVNRVVPVNEIDEYVDNMVATITQNDRQVIRNLKYFINDTFYRGITHDSEFEAMSSSVCLSSPTTQQRLTDFFAKRKK